MTRTVFFFFFFLLEKKKDLKRIYARDATKSREERLNIPYTFSKSNTYTHGSLGIEVSGGVEGITKGGELRVVGVKFSLKVEPTLLKLSLFFFLSYCVSTHFAESSLSLSLGSKTNREKERKKLREATKRKIAHKDSLSLSFARVSSDREV